MADIIVPALVVPKRDETVTLKQDPVVQVAEIPSGGVSDGEESVKEAQVIEPVLESVESILERTEPVEPILEPIGNVRIPRAPGDGVTWSGEVNQPGFVSTDSAYSTGFVASPRGFTRGRRVSSRRSGSFHTGHRHNHISHELTAKAESHFTSLVESMSSASEFMSNATRQASSLKEFWAQMISERECFHRERAEWESHYEEITEELEYYREEWHNFEGHKNDHKKALEKLRLELSIAVSATNMEKQKVAAHQREITKLRRELHESQEKYIHLEARNTELTQTVESQKTLLEEVRSERDGYKSDAEEHERELSKVIREKTQISTSLTAMTAQYESTHREVVFLRERTKELEHQCDEHLHECDRLREECSRWKSKHEEMSTKYIDLTETYEQVQRKLTTSEEKSRELQCQLDASSHTISHLRREVQTITESREEAFKRCSEITLKWEHCKKSLESCKDQIRELEISRKETLSQLQIVQAQNVELVSERDELKEKCHRLHKSVEEFQRRVHILEESLRKSESTMIEVRLQITNLQERVKHLISERDESNSKNEMYVIEITKLNETIVRLQAELEVAKTACEDYCHRLEVIHEEYRESSAEIHRFCSGESYSFELEHLRKSLREARDEKEVAITARKTADRERDSISVKYEEKCRELERMEDYHHHHGHGHNGHNGHYHILEGGRKVSTPRSRVVSRSGTVIHTT